MKFFETEEEKFNKLLKIKELLKSHENQSKLRQLYINFIMAVYNNNIKRDMVFDHVDLYSVNHNMKEIKVHNPLIGFSTDYENIVNIANNIGSNYIQYDIEFSVNIDDYKVLISDYVVGYIPEEEFKLLKMLGKVKDNFIEAKIESAIFCESTNYNEIPF